MRTAEEVASFVIERMDISVGAFLPTENSRSKYRMDTRLCLMDMFRSIEPMLRGGEDILYAIPAASVGSSQQSFGKRSDLDMGMNIMAVFTADRCIFVYVPFSVWVDKPKKFGTFSYDEVVEIKAKQAPVKLIDGYSDGELIVCTTTDILRFRTFCLTGRTGMREKKYLHFTPDQACGTVTELVTKYKQAEDAAQSPAAVPQETSPQATPTITKAAPAAAPKAGTGLPAETVEALKQLKDLLDAGILTQEEFDAKKKQLLGL